MDLVLVTYTSISKGSHTHTHTHTGTHTKNKFPIDAPMPIQYVKTHSIKRPFNCCIAHVRIWRSMEVWEQPKKRERMFVRAIRIWTDTIKKKKRVWIIHKCTPFFNTLRRWLNNKRKPKNMNLIFPSTWKRRNS